MSPDQAEPQPAAPRSSSWIPAGLLVLLSATAFWIYANRSQRLEHEGPGIGLPAPTVDLVQLSAEGNYAPKTKLAPGTVTLIHLWGTWCGPCRMEYPHLDEMVSELKQQGSLEFVSISCESGSSETIDGLTRKTHEYLSSIEADTTTYADPMGETRKSVAKRLGQPSIYFPTSILVDQQGIIRGVWQGYAPEGVEDMRTEIKNLWASGPAA